MKKSTLNFIIATIMTMTVVTACDDASCTLNNKVTIGIALYGSSSKAKFAVADTLTISYYRTDTVLNKAVGTQSVRIPSSLWNSIDTLILKASDETGSITDTVFITKTNTEYYESADCPLKVWHQILDARPSGTSFIDSIEIINTLVSFAEVENLRIYIKQADEE